MNKRKKMTGEDRKREIAMAARGEFAKKGFHGTSMRDLAKAAKVSEALIYQHFPSKVALYEEMYFYLDTQIEAMCDYFKDHEPSTETLVKIIYFLSMMILSERPGHVEEQKIFERLLVYSLLENPVFAKAVFQKYDRELTPLWMASIGSAQKTGDMYESLVDSTLKMWLTHHLTMAINILHMSGEMLFPYDGAENDLIEAVVIFILRGIGLTDEAVRQYAHSKIFKEISRAVFL